MGKDKEEAVVQINFSTCKKYVLSTGLRASKDAVVALQTALGNVAQKIVDKAKEKAESEKRQTIMIGNVSDAVTALNLE